MISTRTRSRVATRLGYETLESMLYDVCREVLGWSESDVDARVRPTREGDGTSNPLVWRGRHEAWESWRDTRDPDLWHSMDKHFLSGFFCSTVGITADNYQKSESMTCFLKKDVIVDFGAGSGFTTVLTAMDNPASKVFWADRPESTEAGIVRYLADRCNLSNIEYGSPEGPVDLTMAFEVCEHLYDGEVGVGNPFSCGFGDLVDRSSAVLYASAWSAEARGYLVMGHFTHYRFGDRLVHMTRAKRAFQDALEDRGLVLIETGWNGAPQLFLRRSCAK